MLTLLTEGWRAFLRAELDRAHCKQGVQFVYPFKVVLHAFLLLGHLYINILFSELLEGFFKVYLCCCRTERMLLIHSFTCTIKTLIFCHSLCITEQMSIEIGKQDTILIQYLEK